VPVSCGRVRAGCRLTGPLLALRTVTCPLPNVPVVANVRDYGAKGDNVTDDTAAFARALEDGKVCETVITHVANVTMTYMYTLVIFLVLLFLLFFASLSGNICLF